MALDEIAPFRPRWSEEHAFRRLYFQLANAQDRRVMAAAYDEAVAKIASNPALCEDAADNASWKKQRIAENRNRQLRK